MIIKHDFDNSENANPKRSEVIGYIKDAIDADAWIEGQALDKQYKGYDGNTYPYYTKEEIKKIPL